MNIDKATYYDKLRAKWKELGPSSVSDADIRAMKAAYAVPTPIEPTVMHWHEPGKWKGGNPSNWGESGFSKDECIAHTSQHEEYQKAKHEWHQSWASFWKKPEIMAKIAKLNEPTMITRKEPTGRLIQVDVTDKGFPIFEPETKTVTVPEGPAWWQSNGYTSRISHNDLEAVFFNHGEVLS